MLKVHQPSTHSFNNPSEIINHKLLIEINSIIRKIAKKGRRYRRSDSEQQENNAKLFIAIRKKK
jgi:hypothetical protein